MEYIEGTDLHNCIRGFRKKVSHNDGNAQSKSHRPRTRTQYIHSKGLVHRDLKPSNVLIDQHVDVKLQISALSKISNRKRKSHACWELRPIPPQSRSVAKISIIVPISTALGLFCMPCSLVVDRLLRKYGWVPQLHRDQQPKAPSLSSPRSPNGLRTYVSVCFVNLTRPFSIGTRDPEALGYLSEDPITADETLGNCL